MESLYNKYAGDIFADPKAMARAILAAADNLRVAKATQSLATSESDAKSRSLDCAVRTILLENVNDPKVLGANDQIRTAVIEDRTLTERLDFYKADTDRRYCLLNVEACEIEWKSLRATAAVLFGTEARS